MDQEQYLNLIRRFLKGMIDKDEALLKNVIAEDARLFHISGKKQSRSEYIQDILDGTLNYYDYQIVSANEQEIKLRLLAKVYGGPTSWWTLILNVRYHGEGKQMKIQECKVRIG